MEDEIFVEKTLYDLISTISRNHKKLTDFLTIPSEDLLTLAAFISAAILSQRPDLEGKYEWLKVAATTYHAQLVESYKATNINASTKKLLIIVPSFNAEDLTNSKKVLH